MGAESSQFKEKRAFTQKYSTTDGNHPKHTHLNTKFIKKIGIENQASLTDEECAIAVRAKLIEHSSRTDDVSFLNVVCHKDIAGNKECDVYNFLLIIDFAILQNYLNQNGSNCHLDSDRIKNLNITQAITSKYLSIILKKRLEKHDMNQCNIDMFRHVHCYENPQNPLRKECDIYSLSKSEANNLFKKHINDN